VPPRLRRTGSSTQTSGWSFNLLRTRARCDASKSAPKRSPITTVDKIVSLAPSCLRLCLVLLTLPLSLSQSGSQNRESSSMFFFTSRCPRTAKTSTNRPATTTSCMADLKAAATRTVRGEWPSHEKKTVLKAILKASFPPSRLS
jgi:hypothetical protein